jgi:hypothetical protein
MARYPPNEGMEYERTKSIMGSTDGFGQLVTKGTRNTLDLPAFYQFSEERYRFIENGTRVQNPDADSTRFTDQDKQFLIEPEAGDTLEFKTAEAPRYIVGSDAAVSWSFQFLTGLVDETDTFELFLGDAFEIEYDGAGNVTFRSNENGAEQVAEDVTPPNGLESPSRPEFVFNWYAVGRAELEIDFTANNEQATTDPVTLTVDDDWLSDDPTGQMGFRLDVANAGIQLEAGSMAFIPQTDTTPTSRPKPHLFSESELNQVAADGYTVVGAFRVDPDRDNVFTTVSEVQVFAEQSVDVELWLESVAPGDTDADFLDVDDDGTDEGPLYPRNNSPSNSVIQWTPNVSTFPTRNYALTDTPIPTGRSNGAATQYAGGQGSGSTRTTQPLIAKRPVYPDDVVLMIGHTPNESTAADVSVSMLTEQDW